MSQDIPTPDHCPEKFISQPGEYVLVPTESSYLSSAEGLEFTRLWRAVVEDPATPNMVEDFPASMPPREILRRLRLALIPLPVPEDWATPGAYRMVRLVAECGTPDLEEVAEEVASKATERPATDTG